MKNILDLTWLEVKNLDKINNIILITIAPIEQHSLHLPLGTDVYEGEYWLEGVSKELSTKLNNISCYKLPPLTVASATTTSFYGCIHYKCETTKEVTYEFLKNVASFGFKNIIIIASHGDPVHHIAIEQACDLINSEFGMCAISPMGAFFSSDELNINLHLPEEIKGLLDIFPNDIHSGWIETSAMLDINSKLVKDNYNTMKPISINETEMLNNDIVINKMGDCGHLGAPHLANSNIGKLLNENTIDYLVTATTSFINREDFEIYQHHFLYKYKAMF